jgi:hypothetical protein
MKLMYVVTKTRPDILFAVSYLASRSSHPTLHDLKCVERIKAYLNGTRNYGLKVDVEDMTLQASVDASHGIMQKTPRVTQGWSSHSAIPPFSPGQ